MSNRTKNQQLASLLSVVDSFEEEKVLRAIWNMNIPYCPLNDSILEDMPTGIYFDIHTPITFLEKDLLPSENREDILSYVRNFVSPLYVDIVSQRISTIKKPMFNMHHDFTVYKNVVRKGVGRVSKIKTYEVCGEQHYCDIYGEESLTECLVADGLKWRKDSMFFFGEEMATSITNNIRKEFKVKGA